MSNNPGEGSSQTPDSQPLSEGQPQPPVVAEHSDKDLKVVEPSQNATEAKIVDGGYIEHQDGSLE